MENYKKTIEEINSKTSVKLEDIYDYENSPYNNDFEKLFQFFNETLQRNKSIYDIDPCRVYFNNTRSINAKAGKISGYFLISINMGLIVNLYEKYILKVNYFDKSDEMLTDYFELEKNLDNPLNVLMYQAATNFTFYHEFGHLVQKSKGLNLWLHEQNDSNSRYSFDKHLKEIDADIFSSLYIGSHIIQYIKKIFGATPNIKNVEMLISVFSCAILLYIQMFESNTSSIYYKEKSHPHPLIRIIYVINNIIKYIEESLKIENTSLRIESGKVMRETLLLTEKISLTFFNEERFDDFVTMYSENHKEIDEYRDELSLKLIDDQSLSVHKRNKFAVINK